MQESNKWWQKITNQEWRQYLTSDDVEYHDEEGRLIHFTKYELQKLDELFKRLLKQHSVHTKFRYTQRKESNTGSHKLLVHNEKYSTEPDELFRKRFTSVMVHSRAIGDFVPDDTLILLSRGSLAYSELIAIQYIISREDYYLVYIYATRSQPTPWEPGNVKKRQFVEIGDIYRCDGITGLCRLLEELALLMYE